MASQAAEALAQHLGSTQREPSMEEILASIRRIIEDSDTGRSAQDAFPVAANMSTPQMGVADVDTFRAELRGSGKEAAGSHADGTRAVAETSRDEPGPQAHAPEAPVAPASDMSFTARVERKLQTARVEPLSPATPQDDWKQRMAPALPPEPAAVIEPVAVEPAAIEPTATEEPVASLPEAQRPSIISEVAGRQVAAAFGELSDVFAASRRRSFDEVAEEMMRPMLQDWLDNNLPTLVERLVREEIERVARGAAR